MNKVIGYIISIIGIGILTIFQFPQLIKFIEDSTKISLKQFNIGVATLVGLVISLIGIFLVLKSKKKYLKYNKTKEVPIYQGKEIVGYRRH